MDQYRRSSRSVFAWDHDFRNRRPHAFEAVDLARGSARGGRVVAGPQQRGTEVLLVRLGHRGHAVGVRELSHDDARRAQRRELVPVHATGDRGRATEVPVGVGTEV